jgi:hypothetical protein
VSRAPRSAELKANFRAIARSNVAQLTKLQRELSEEEDDEAMQLYDNFNVNDAEAEDGEDDIRKVLNQLRKEPTNDEETKAKRYPTPDAHYLTLLTSKPRG